MCRFTCQEKKPLFLLPNLLQPHRMKKENAMHALEVIIALNKKAVLQALDNDKKTIERVLADLRKEKETPAVLILKKELRPVTV